jgi:hypothetical protein
VLTSFSLLEWCQLDATTSSLTVLYATHLPDSSPSFSPLLETDRFAVAYGAEILIYAVSGLVGSLSMQSVFSSSISTLTTVMEPPQSREPMIDDQRGPTMAFLLATREDGVYLVDLLIQDSSLELILTQRLREHVSEVPVCPSLSWHDDPDDLSSRYSPLLPFYTHLIPLFLIHSHELWKMLVVGFHRSIGAQMITLQIDHEQRTRGTEIGLVSFSIEMTFS